MMRDFLHPLKAVLWGLQQRQMQKPQPTFVPAYANGIQEGALKAFRWVDKLVRTDQAEDDPFLKDFVLLQAHTHTHTCKATWESACRFGYPRPVTERTRLTGDMDKQRRAKWYVERRKEGDENVVAYNEGILTWNRGNTDISFVGNVEACAASAPADRAVLEGA